jgi:chloramphenicol-sensitive protein RarD
VRFGSRCPRSRLTGTTGPATFGPLPSSPPSPSSLAGGWSAAIAFFIWGVVPIYWKQMQGVSAFELIAHRSTWSLALLLGLVAWQGRLAGLRAVFASPAAIGLNLCSSVLLAANWTVYVWAVNAGQVIESSLGYFLVPLANVALGSLFLHEKLRPLQWAAIGCAAAGVALLLWRVGHVPWVAFALAGTWAAYGLLKKKSPLGSVTGLTVETILLLPATAGLLLWLGARGEGVIGHADARTHAYVLSSGLVTSVPLVLFAYGAQRIRLTTLGLLQYIGPTVQFLIGLLVYREPFDSGRLQAFGLIWIGLAIYSADTFWTQRRTLLRAAGVG